MLCLFLSLISACSTGHIVVHLSELCHDAGQVLSVQVLSVGPLQHSNSSPALLGSGVVLCDV